MKEEKYTLKQIVQVVKDIYEVDSSKDSWGVSVIYKGSFLSALKKRLKKIKQFIN